MTLPRRRAWTPQMGRTRREALRSEGARRNGPAARVRPDDATLLRIARPRQHPARPRAADKEDAIPGPARRRRAGLRASDSSAARSTGRNRLRGDLTTTEGR